jgi:hypothetical protein
VFLHPEAGRLAPKKFEPADMTCEEREAVTAAVSTGCTFNRDFLAVVPQKSRQETQLALDAARAELAAESAEAVSLLVGLKSVPPAQFCCFCRNKEGVGTRQRFVAAQGCPKGHVAHQKCCGWEGVTCRCGCPF